MIFTPAILSYAVGRENIPLAQASQELLTYEQGYTDGVNRGIMEYVAQSKQRHAEELRLARVYARAEGMKDMLNQAINYLVRCQEEGWEPTPKGFESFIETQPQRVK